MTDILFIQPPVSFIEKMANSGQDSYPLGLTYVVTSVKKAGYSVRAINNAGAVLSINDILAIIEVDGVKIVGISCLLATIPATVKIAKAIKERFADKVHVLLGNAYISIDPSVMERYPYFDSAIDGEADITVINHIKRILNGEKVSGIIKAEYPLDLDALPFPDFSLIERTQYKRGQMIPIIGTRGCPFRCGYCARQALSKLVRTRSGKNVVDEIVVRLPQTNHFFFNDDSATLKNDYVIGLCNEIINRKLKIKFSIITRLDAITQEAAFLLKRAGCYTIMVGIESGNERIRNEVIKKSLTDEQIIRGLSLIKKAEISVQLFFMLGHPEETKADIIDTLNYPVKLWKIGFTNIEMVGYHITIPVPKTPYFEWALKRGKILQNVIDDYIQGKLGEGFMGNWPYLIPDGMMLKDLIYYRKLGTKMFFLRLSYILRRFLRVLLNPRQFISDLINAIYIIRFGTSSDKSKIEIKQEL